MKKQEIKPLSSYIQRHLKREKGITLIALVTTIVVLIILALMGINIAFKDDGALNGAEKSAEVQSNSTIKEQEEANTYVAEIENDNELKLAVTQKINSSPTSNNEYVQDDIITYEVTITNTGEKNLVDLVLTDKMTRPDRTEGTPSGLPDGMKVIERLGVGESITLTYTHTVENIDLGGNLKNEVKVVGYAEDNPRENIEVVSRISVATQI